MEQINTLLDRTTGLAATVLPDGLRVRYGGDLLFPAHDDQPYVIGNFVSTLDGVVSFEVPGKSGGSEISGFNEVDRFIMGLLRASACAVIIGAGTLRATAPGHLWLPEHIYPEARELYAQYRREVLAKAEPPLNVIVSGHGDVDLQRAAFRVPGVRTLVVTSPNGRELLIRNGVTALGPVEVRVIESPDGKIDPPAILKLLHREFGVKLVLHEGGPALFGDFVAGGCVDEIFLTVSPQFAGRDGKRPRPGVIAGTAFPPETAPWLRLVSVKHSADHLYLRYDNLRSHPR